LRVGIEGLMPESVRSSDDYQEILNLGGLDNKWRSELLNCAAALTSITGVKVQD